MPDASVKTKTEMSKTTIFKRTRAGRLLAFYLILSLLIITQNSPAQQIGSPGVSQGTLATPINLDFEQGEIGQVPAGWQSLTQGKGYAAETTNKTPQGGMRAALLRTEPNTAVKEVRFGNLMQAIDAAPFRGHRVRLRAAVRLEADEQPARAHLWMRVDRQNKQTGFLDSMPERPITSKDWRFYEIVGDLDEDAEILNFGMILFGRATAYLDSVTLEDLGKPTALAEPPRALTKRGLENITSFVRLLGYVRHFHPSDEAAATDWDAFTTESLRRAENAKNASELAGILESLFRPIAPTVRVYPTGKSLKLAGELTPPPSQQSLKVVSWQHVGYGHKNSQAYGYRSERISSDVTTGTAAVDAPDPRQPFRADLGGGVSCLVPLALYADSKGTLPHTAFAKPSTAQYKHSPNDRTTRLAAVAQAWNVLQHFYPYFDVVKTDWNKTLKDSLTKAAADKDEKEFGLTLRMMVAQLHDGHGNVLDADSASRQQLPVIFRWIENRLVIVRAGENAQGLQPGDVVISFDGKPSAEAVAELEAISSSATPQWLRQKAMMRLQIGAKDSEARLEIENAAGERRFVTLRRNAESASLQERTSAKIAEVKPGIFYVDLDRVNQEEFKNALPQLAAAKGIVFDIRGYPKVTFDFLSYLTDKPLLPPQFLRPVITKPDHSAMTFPAASDFALPPSKPRLTAKMAFLTDGRAVSYAESVLGIIENYKLGEIVGEPTAGTNGNINPFDVIGNYRIVFTGMKVLKHDGSQHHGIGIKPTVPVSRTIQGIRDGRDEQLERAISVVSQN